MTRRKIVSALLALEFLLAVGIAQCVAELRPDAVRVAHAAVRIALRRHAHPLHAALSGNSRTYRESAPAIAP